jgi:sugar/nucleoside kinase (ribokinase family)
MQRKILFAGDGNLDLILSGLEGLPQEDKEVFCEEYTVALGGSCTIAASAYARLGGTCDYCGLLGNDTNGDLVFDFLGDAGVGTGLVRRDADVKTGVTVNLVRAKTRTQVTYPGSLSLVDETETILRELDKYTHIHLSGLYGTKLFLPRVQEVLLAAKSAGITTSIDTQWDSSEEWCYADSWLPLLTWLFVNEDEASSLVKRYAPAGSNPTPGKEVWDCLSKLTPSPIIKLGPQGAYAGGKLYPPIEIGRIVDTTGAGDCFAAGFLYGMIEERRGFVASLCFAQASGALACSFEGGSSVKFTREKVDALSKQGKDWT